MDLLELARERFGKLSEAEEKLFQAVVEGKVADYSAESDADNDPAGAADWSEERVLDAQRIVWLCIDPQASALVTHRGIRVTGARIDGDLDLSFAEVQSLLRLLRCAIRGRIDLIHTAVRMLVLSGTHTGPITADGLKVQGGVLLREGFKAAGELRLLGATIGGNLECNGGEFVNQQGHALSGDGLKVEGSVFLREGFKAEGEVGLLGATIGRNLDCSGASFLNQAGRALTGDGLKVEGNVLLGKGFKAAGEVRLSGARIGGTLACIAGEFVNQDGNALRGDRLKVEGSVFLREGFKAAGEVRLLGATIGGNLECEDSEFANKEGVALNADRLKVHGNVFLRDGFNVNGAVSLVGASIEGAVVWRHVSASTGVTLDLRHARIRTLLDESASWPAPGKLHIDGLVYDHIREPAPIDAQSRIEWLRR